MVNNVVFQGRLTAEPELRQTSSNVPYMKFTVAWSKKVKEVEKKCFLRCTAWRSTAEMIDKYFVKGQEIVVTGELETSEYTGNDGQKRSETVLTVNEVNFCGSAKKSDGDGAAAAKVAQTKPIAPSMPDFAIETAGMEPLSASEDLPF